MDILQECLKVPSIGEEVMQLLDNSKVVVDGGGGSMNCIRNLTRILFELKAYLNIIVVFLSHQILYFTLLVFTCIPITHCPHVSTYHLLQPNPLFSVAQQKRSKVSLAKRILWSHSSGRAKSQKQRAYSNAKLISAMLASLTTSNPVRRRVKEAPQVLSVQSQASLMIGQHTLFLLSERFQNFCSECPDFWGTPDPVT